jgi:uncharacterized protein (DUF433 family)
MQQAEQYVQYRDGVWYVGRSGVQVYGVIAMWQQGFAPEEIRGSFPSLSLEAVYGTILYYLEQREAMDAFFREQDALFAQRKAEAEAKDPAFYTAIRERAGKLSTAQGPASPATTS